MVRKSYCYADGGKVVKDHTAAPKAPQGERLKYGVLTPGGQYQIDKPAGVVDAMKNTRKKQMEDLGLRDGGAVSNFDKLKSKFAREGKRSPGGLAYAIGAAKYGKKGMAAKAAAGRKKG